MSFHPTNLLIFWKARVVLPSELDAIFVVVHVGAPFPFRAAYSFISVEVSTLTIQLIGQVIWNCTPDCEVRTPNLSESTTTVAAVASNNSTLIHHRDVPAPANPVSCCRIFPWHEPLTSFRIAYKPAFMYSSKIETFKCNTNVSFTWRSATLEE